jgi:hypothetical protein
MKTEIVYHPGRWMYSEFAYDVLIDDSIVACASFYTHGEIVAQEVQGRSQCAYAACIQQRTHDDTGFCCYHNEEETGTRCDCENDDYADAMAEQAMDSYNGEVPQDYDNEPTFAQRYIAPMFEVPLLAQCAAVIDSCLGGPVIGGGILDELRRVRAELKREGW